MKEYNFNDFYEEIRNETDEKRKAEFYEHWGKPFKNSVFRKQLKEESEKRKWQDKRNEQFRKMLEDEEIKPNKPP